MLHVEALVKQFKSLEPPFMTAKHSPPSPPTKALRWLAGVGAFAFLAGAVVLPVGLSLGLTGCSVEESGLSKNRTYLAQPVVDERLSKEDFSFPSEPPKLTNGKTVFANNCASCHAAAYWQKPTVQEHLTYSTPIDYYLFLTTGHGPAVFLPTNERRKVFPANHMPYRDKLSRQERWEVIFYTRYLAGLANMQFKSLDGKPLDLDTDVYGGNCAVCHGKRGHADGFLHTGKASSHELQSAPIHGVFYPPPANFTQYVRVYNRTDAQWFKYLCEGIYPSAMPSWFGNIDRTKNFVFNHELLWKLPRYLRTKAYNNDLPETEAVPPGPIPKQTCSPVPTNQYWRTDAPSLIEPPRSDRDPSDAPKTTAGGH
jgi:mono/diheme cytochrome c family protein